MMEKFLEVYQNRHKYQKEYRKRTGNKVVGYFCTYVPEEILYAADILPVRILGGHEPPSLAVPHLFDMWCPFSRDCLSQGLAGKYDYLDGVMIAQSCLHQRHAFAAWEINVPTPWKYFLCMPNAVRSPHAKSFLAGELMDFKKAVEEWVGRPITEEDLARGIDIVNTNRRLMKQVYQFRKKDNPPLTGAEAMTMVWASQLMDKREHNEILKEVLAELPERKLERDPGVRLMMVGSENDDLPFISMVENNLPGTFVIEDHCTGARYFWDEVVTNGDGLQAIANRYCDRVPCANKDWGPVGIERKRFAFILNLAQEYKVQGVLLIQQKFCDPHELDIPSLRRRLEANGLPCYFLEFEVTVPVGQFRIRVEAFLEQIRAEDLFS
ncbi:MAG: 2-hydroxyacyl-CoA dehydratase [Thermodesulfobacteriota bacterium]